MAIHKSRTTNPMTNKLTPVKKTPKTHTERNWTKINRS